MLAREFRIVNFLVLLVLSIGVASASDLMKPFMLASTGSGDLTSYIEDTKAKLTNANFEIVGEYSPYDDASIIVVTSNELKIAAAKSLYGGYGAGQRVSITKVGDEIQIAYTNPAYMANAYRMKESLEGVATKLKSALGFEKEFGPKEGMTASEIREYHYMFGMEYFDEPSLLVQYKSHGDALKAVEAALAENKGGVSKIYRIDVPGKDESVFGISLSKECSSDKFIMGHIDFKDIRSTAHLPYEMLVSGKDVYALYARFRIAINFPDLKMIGDNSFFKIMCAPDAIEESLMLGAGGKIIVEEFEQF